ncbi:MAG: O-methyltransferase [Fusobacteriaceae bacterium]
MLEELKEANEYIIKKIVEKNKLIIKMEEYARENNVPIITKEVAKYLEFLIKSHKFNSILEIGTAIGYSGIVMLEAMNEKKGKLVTIEIDEIRYEEAKKNFKESGYTNIMTYLGDANEVLPNLVEQKESFDFIFIDASKGQYQNFFEESYKMLSRDGIIFIDNIMFRGYLYKEYPKRFKTIVKKLDKFIDYLYESHNFVLLPFGDGVGLVSSKLSVK